MEIGYIVKVDKSWLRLTSLTIDLTVLRKELLDIILELGKMLALGILLVDTESSSVPISVSSKIFYSSDSLIPLILLFLSLSGLLLVVALTLRLL